MGKRKMDVDHRSKLIRSSLVLLDVTQADIARAAGVSRQMVSHVIYGKRKSAKVENVLLKLGIPESLVRY